MVDILVRNVDDETAQRLKDKAVSKGTSLAEIAREALTAFATPTKDEAWAELDRIRKRNGKMSTDSTEVIRAHRDNDERWR